LSLHFDFQIVDIQHTPQVPFVVAKPTSMHEVWGIIMRLMEDRVCTVTGSNSGIGKETALALGRIGATVVMAVRSQEGGEKARVEIVGKTGNPEIDLVKYDQSSTDSIREFAGEFEKKRDRLDVLINNAGAFFGRRQITIDGLQRTLAVDYLGSFLLTHELLPLLRSSAPSRIINTESGMENSGKTDLSDLQSEKRYNAINVYANAKLMLTMYTYELARRLGGTGVTVNVVEPGFVATNLSQNSGSRLLSLAFWIARPLQISAEKGVETLVYLASALEVEGVTGKCYSRLKQTATAQISYDHQMQGRLWDTTMKLLGLT